MIASSMNYHADLQQNAAQLRRVHSSYLNRTWYCISHVGCVFHQVDLKRSHYEEKDSNALIIFAESVISGFIGFGSYNLHNQLAHLLMLSGLMRMMWNTRCITNSLIGIHNYMYMPVAKRSWVGIYYLTICSQYIACCVFELYVSMDVPTRT
jgi:hypothetical protein